MALNKGGGGGGGGGRRDSALVSDSAEEGSPNQTNRKTSMDFQVPEISIDPYILNMAGGSDWFFTSVYYGICQNV